MITKYKLLPYEDTLVLIREAINKDVPFSAVNTLTYILMFAGEEGEYFYYSDGYAHFPSHDYDRNMAQEDLDELVKAHFLEIE